MLHCCYDNKDFSNDAVAIISVSWKICFDIVDLLPFLFNHIWQYIFACFGRQIYLIAFGLPFYKIFIWVIADIYGNLNV